MIFLGKYPGLDFSEQVKTKVISKIKFVINSDVI